LEERNEIINPEGMKGEIENVCMGRKRAVKM